MNYDFEEWKIELSPGYSVGAGGDFDGPVVTDVTPVLNSNIKIIFNEDVETTTAENISNYVINNDVVVESAVQHTFNKTQVNLTVTPLSGDYEITVQNVEDVLGNVMEEQTIPFSYVGIEEFLLDGEVEVFPNPASDQVNISFVSNEEFDFNIVVADISGRQMINEEYFAKQGVNKYNLNLNGLRQGVYLLSLRGEKGTLNFKLIIR